MYKKIISFIENNNNKEDIVAIRRRVYLINPQFQLRFSIYVCVLIFCSSIIYPFSIYELMDKFINFAIKYSPEDRDKLEEQRQNIIMILSLLQICFTAAFFIVCIFFSHKIAGPLYKMKLHLNSLKEGKNLGTLFFRKGDYFPELAQDYNEAIDKVMLSRKEDFTALTEISEQLTSLKKDIPDSQKDVLDNIHKKVVNMKSRFEINT